MTAVGLAGLALLSGGCAGLGSDDEVPERVSGPTLVTKGQIQRLPSRSPERSMFEWWRSIQFDNAPVAATYYASRLKMTPAKLDKILEAGATTLGLTSRPRLVDVDRHGDEAAVLVLLESVDTKPNGRKDKTLTARAFNMVYENGGWKVADNRYLDRTIFRIKRFSAEARREQGQGENQRDAGQDQAAP